MRINFDDTPRSSQRREKGIFGTAKLTAAAKYITPPQALPYLRTISIISAALTVLWLLDVLLWQASSTTAGDASSVHANFGNDCSKCHVKFANAPATKCEGCHEKSVRANKAFGTYSFPAHYVYRSADTTRAATKRTIKQETPCRACHAEHMGRDHKLAAVPDSKCLTCHDYHSFTRKHPEFQFIRESAADDSSLIFTHIRHVREVLKQEKETDTEKACLYCHNPRLDGKLFGDIDYDRHCSACHLQNTNTAPLPVTANNQDGVLTVETIRANPSVATLWANNYDPTAFDMLPGNRIVKKRVMHKDPWVIYNLNQLQQTDDMIELSDSFGQPNTFQDVQAKMRAAILRLSGTGNTDLQAQLFQADSILSRLNVSSLAMQINLADSLNETNSTLIGKLSQPCQECHVLSGGQIKWVNGRQDILKRANFNHRAHIVQRGCLDCHNRIVINPSGADSLLAVKADRSSVQNLPAKTACIKCHNGNETTQRCIICHEFHI